MDTTRYTKISGRKFLKVGVAKELPTHRLLNYFKKRVRRIMTVVYKVDGMRGSELKGMSSNLSKAEEDKLLEYHDEIKSELDERKHVEQH